MGITEEILKTLNLIPGWKRIVGLPAEVDALKTRLDALEKRSGDPACPRCHALTFRLEASTKVGDDEDIAMHRETRRCTGCGFEQTLRLKDY